jgi:hypothetical protein
MALKMLKVPNCIVVISLYKKGAIKMENYVVNNAGATIYCDINKHKLLPILPLPSHQTSRVIYEVLTVGMHWGGRTPIATVKDYNKVVAYILPSELHGWVENILLMSTNGLRVPLPAKVEFGVLGGRLYAEILEIR